MIRLFQVIVISIFLLASLNASAETKIGFVNLQKLLDSPQSLEAGKKLQAEFTPRNNELNKFKKQIEDKQAAYDKDQVTLSDADRKKRSQELQNLTVDFQRKQRELAEDFDMRKNEEKNKLQNRINNAVTSLAQAEGYDLVLYGNAAYAGKSIDITDKVIKSLK